MKTPREILLRRHQAIEPKLDAIRQSVVADVAAVCDRREPVSAALTERRYNWREWLCALRWHLAGMGATWFVIALLGLSAGHPAGPMAAVPAQKIPSAQIIMASLRENRRELREMIQPTEGRDFPPHNAAPTQPRSQRSYETSTT